jgi:hypothetical protein
VNLDAIQPFLGSRRGAETQRDWLSRFGVSCHESPSLVIASVATQSRIAQYNSGLVDLRSPAARYARNDDRCFQRPAPVIPYSAPPRLRVKPDFTVNLHAFLGFLAIGWVAVFASPNAALAQEHDHSKMDHGEHRSNKAPQKDYRSGCFSVGVTIEDKNGDYGGQADGTRCNPIEGSGTSRLPGNEGGHSGLHINAGNDWMLMLHGYVWGVYTNQSGPRGDSKTYAQSMAMINAQKDTNWGRIQLKSMLSLEPLMKNEGYPNLFATGETNNGEPLVDRQHPHDLFMELAARVDVNIAEDTSIFVYGGPVGEPALGPSAFMHRGSARYNPEAPITHHWFDSSHITYGVGTIGIANRQWQVEASVFTGREPDEKRWNIETPRFDSWSLRTTWSPSPQWTLQASTGRLKTPEFLIHPDEDEQRSTASVHFANGKGLTAMLAFSAKDRRPGPTLTAFLAEANWDITDHHTLFGRVENVKNDELFPDDLDPLHETPFRVTKFQAGYAYRLPLAGPVNLALGGTVSAFAKPDALDAAYGKNPIGATVFAKLSLGH